MNHADVIVVGGGIVGLATAFEAVDAGRSVILLERSARAVGASIRNFGMIKPVAMPPGPLLERALRNRSRWLELADRASLAVAECGSLHAARREDELAVIEEFAARAPDHGYRCAVVGPDEAVRRSPGLRRDGLLGALWSDTELGVEPRDAVARLTALLAAQDGAEVRLRTAAAAIGSAPGGGPEVLLANGARLRAERVVVCNGHDFETLYPDLLAAAPLTRCKLQMVRTSVQPNGWRLGPHVAGGLTLRHYHSFRLSPSLPALAARLDAETPEYARHGVHVMASQTPRGELTIGDSHSLRLDDDPFVLAEIETLIMDYARTLLDAPDLAVAERWAGVYAKRTDAEPCFMAEPAPGVQIVNAVSGAGMTLAFGVAHDMARGRYAPGELWATARGPVGAGARA